MAMSRGSTSDIILQGGRKLDLRDRSLSTQDVTALATLLSTSRQVSVLILYNVRLNSDDAVSLARALEFNDTLTTLNFTHNPIGEVGTAALAEMIKFNTTIREVSLANTVLNSQACALLADALIMNQSLESLNLEKNRIAAQGAHFLAGALGDNETLHTLWLDGNQIGDAGAKSIAATLAVEGGSRLERLSLANTGITEAGAAALGDALAGNLWMKRLVMTKLELAPQVLQGRVEEGEEASAASKGLQTIDLSGKSLSATLDYPIVCRLAAGNPRLARLRLSRAGICGVTSGGRGRRSLVGLHSLALTLKAAPPRLVVLDLGHNFLDDEAIEVIARGLEKNRVLTSLILQGNGIGEKGMTFLAASLPASIVELDLSNNPAVGEKGGKAIARFLLDFVRSANLRRLDVSMCNLRDEGLASLAEGVEAAKGLEWLGIARNLNDPGSVVGAGAGSGAGKTAIGLALLSLSGEESRLQGLSTDLWTVSKGQKDLKLTRPKGTVPCQLPSSADVCLLAGVICVHDWLRRVSLDGNPIDEDGLGYLCRALLKNGSVQSVSLNRCGLGERSGVVLLHMLEEKPGLEVDALLGNPLGEEVEKKLAAALKHARQILTAKTECRRTTVHLLGEAGAGKTTLKETLGRGYFSSFFNTSEENAQDKGAEDPSQRTLGIARSALPLGAGSANILVHDYGGMPRFRGLGALNGGLACPTSVYVVVVSLTADRSESKRQIKYWLRLIQTVGPSTRSVILLVGSRADELGSVGQDYLQKLWERAREDLTREELRAGLDASMPTFVGCLAMDCRKAGSPNVVHLREAIAHADKLFGQQGEGWSALRLYPAIARRVGRWSREGATLVRWAKFVAGVQRQLCPRASDAACADLAYSLAREGRVVLKGMSRGREVDRGKGWVALHPGFFVHDIVGGVFRSTGRGAGGKGSGDAGGVVSATMVCEAVIGGLGTMQAEALVQALIDGDVCAELPSADNNNNNDNDDDDGAAGGDGCGVIDEALGCCSSSTARQESQQSSSIRPATFPAAQPLPPVAAGGGAAAAAAAAGGGGGGAAAGAGAGAGAPFGADYEARPSSEKIERKRVMSAAGARATSTATATATATASRPSPGSAPTVGSRKGSGLGRQTLVLPPETAGLAAAAEANDNPHPDSAAMARRPSERWRALGIRKESWAKLARTRLLFPALLPPAEASAGRGQGRRVDHDSEAHLCGRRVACRSPILLPGLFHMLQARLANRFKGQVTLRDRYVEISLDAWDAAGGGGGGSGVAAPTGSADGDGGSNDGSETAMAAATAAISAAVELVESDLPGRDAIDVTVASNDRKASLLTVLGLRVVVEQVLCQAPTVAVEDMAIAAASIRDGRTPLERLTLPMSDVRQNRKDGLKECFFGDNTLPEPLSDLLWDGPEEYEVDEAGRMVSVYGKIRTARFTPESAASESSPPTVVLNRNSSPPATANAVANPFGDGFSRRKKVTTTSATGSAGSAAAAAAAAAPITPMNPFAPAAVVPPPTNTNTTAIAAGKKPAPSSSSSSNPFATPPPTAKPVVEKRAAAAAGGAGKAQGSGKKVAPNAGEEDVDGFSGPGGEQECGARTTAASSSLPSQTGDGSDSSPTTFTAPEGPGEFPEIVGGGDNLSGRVSSARDGGETGSPLGANKSSGSTPAFSFNGEVFQDPTRLFGAHLGGKSYKFGRQRVEVVLRKPGGLKLGIWRPPLDEREEREREKEKGKAASETVTVEDHQLSRMDGSTHDGKTQDFNVFLPTGDIDDNVSSSTISAGETRGSVDTIAPETTVADGLSATSMDSPRRATSPPYSPSNGGTVRSTAGVDGRLMGLLTGRPAVVEEVLHESVVTGFNCLGSSTDYGVVGCVVASVSREPFQETEVSPKLLTFEEARAALASAEYPLFVQLCRPPLLFNAEPEYPAVKLLSTLALTNRNVEKVDGEFRLGHLMAEDGGCRWLLTTTAVPASVGDLGKKVEVDLGDYHLVGLYLLTSDEAMALLRGYPSRDVFLFVHGFNTSFNFGTRSCAVTGRAVKKGLTVCLTWPSNPPGEGAGWLIKRVMSTYERRYTYCEHNMHASIFLFLQVALDIKAAADASGKVMCWKSHSMGCYLLLNVVDRLRWKGEDMKSLFGAVILDAPDVPTWFFRSMTKVLAEHGVSVCHYFNPSDNAIQASCSRRALHRPVPGQDAILAHPLVQGVLCDKSHSSTGMNHDYGRADGRCLLDQRDFLAGEPPDQRVLEEIASAEGVPCWQLKTW